MVSDRPGSRDWPWSFETQIRNRFSPGSRGSSETDMVQWSPLRSKVDFWSSHSTRPGPPCPAPFDFHPGVLGTQVGRGIDSRRQVGKRPALDRSYGYLADPRGAQISHRDHVTQPGCPPDVAQPKLNSVVGLLGGDPGRESSSRVVEDGNLRHFGPVEQDRGLEGLLILPELETSGED